MALLNDASSAGLLESSGTRVDRWCSMGMYGQIRCVFIFSNPIQRLSAENASLFSRYEAAAASLVSRSCMVALARISLFYFFALLLFCFRIFPIVWVPSCVMEVPKPVPDQKM